MANESNQCHEKLRVTDLAFTGVISLSAKDFTKIRSALLDMITDLSETIDASNSEIIAYLGIDWIEL